MSVGTVDRDVGQDSTAAPQPSRATQGGETISIVLPCLNEEESIAHCIAWAQEGLARTGLPGEIIVVDNGSTDRSAELARAAGARVVYQPLRGYGNAYHKGLAAATGTYLVMGDADQSYDFREIDRLIAPLRAGYDYVLGSRFRGTILPGAMPWTHRYIGNPLLTFILNVLFGLKSSDAHSGLRAFTRAPERRSCAPCTMGGATCALCSPIAARTRRSPTTVWPRRCRSGQTTTSRSTSSRAPLLHRL